MKKLSDGNTFLRFTKQDTMTMIITKACVSRTVRGVAAAVLSTRVQGGEWRAPGRHGHGSNNNDSAIQRQNEILPKKQKAKKRII